jgi:hypothetical protein
MCVCILVNALRGRTCGHMPLGVPYVEVAGVGGQRRGCRAAAAASVAAESLPGLFVHRSQHVVFVCGPLVLDAASTSTGCCVFAQPDVSYLSSGVLSSAFYSVSTAQLINWI